MDLLILIRMMGLLAATVIGCYRIKVNYLRRHEKYIYVLASFTTTWFFMADLISQLREALGLEISITHAIFRMGWPFMLSTLILFMLYYRRFPKVK